MFILSLGALSDRFVGRRTAANLVDNEHDSILDKSRKTEPKLVVGDGLYSFSSTSELEEDESSDEVDCKGNKKAVSIKITNN